jgi:hypothetical protein
MFESGLFTHWVPEFTIPIATDALQDLEDLHSKSYNTFIQTVTLRHDSTGPTTAVELFAIFKAIQKLLDTKSISFESMKFQRVGNPSLPRFTLMLAADIFKQFSDTVFEIVGIDQRDLVNLEDDRQFLRRVKSINLAMISREACLLHGIELFLSTIPRLQSFTICYNSAEEALAQSEEGLSASTNCACD